jgi:hypothetical protein
MSEEKGEACRSTVWNQVKYQTVRDIARTVGEYGGQNALLILRHIFLTFLTFPTLLLSDIHISDTFIRFDTVEKGQFSRHFYCLNLTSDTFIEQSRFPTLLLGSKKNLSPEIGPR